MLKLQANKQNKIQRLWLRQEVPRPRPVSSVQPSVLGRPGLSQAPGSATRRVSLSCLQFEILSVRDHGCPVRDQETPHQSPLRVPAHPPKPNALSSFV